jgi:hypothetical protein
MAYQPKSYRKFVATAATATLVASAVVPAVSAASVSDFTDVPSKYQDAVKYLVDNGITQGTTKTTFGTSDNVKRGDAAIWLTKALGLDTTNAAPSGFTDTGRYDAAVSVLKAKNILGGKTATTFDPNGLLTRGEMAKILANAYELESDAAVPFTDLGPNFGPYIKALYAYEITGGKTPTTFGTSEKITRGDLAIFLKKAAEVEVAPAVESVMAINAKDIDVVFNSLLDKVTAEDAANYVVTVNNGTALTAGTDYTVEVDANNAKKVNLVLSDAQALSHGDYVTVTVKDDVLTNELTALSEDYITSFTFTDKVAPSVVKAEINGADIVVTFDDYVSNVGLVKVDGDDFAVTAINTSLGTTKSKTITLAGAATGLATGNHSVVLGNVADLNTNVTTYATTQVAVSDDTVKPAVSSVEKLGEYTFLVKFNKEVSVPTVTAKKSGYGLTVSSVAPKDGSGTDDEYIVTVDDALPVEVYATGEESVTLSVGVTGYQALSNDMYGDVYTGSVTLSTDKTAPTVVNRFSKIVDRGTTPTVDEGFEFQFSEALAAGSVDATKVVLKDKDGIRQDPENYTVSVENDPEGNPTVLRVESTDVVTTGAIDAGTYNVELGAGAVTDLAGNNNAAASVTFTKTSATPTDINLTSAISASGRTIDIAFGENMTTSATTLANYKIDNQPLPAGTLIYFDVDKQNVQIVLPAGYVSKTADVLFTISSNVVSEDGSKIEAADLNTVLTGLTDDVAPLLVSATKVDSTHIKLTFNEGLAAQTVSTATLNDDFVVKVNGTVINITDNAAITLGDKSVVFEVNTYNTAQTVTVTSATESTSPALTLNLTDVQGNKVKSGTTVTAN